MIFTPETESIGSIMRMKHLMLFLVGLYIQQVAEAVVSPSPSVSQPIQLHLLTGCGSMATLEWTVQGSNSDLLQSQKCELTYSRTKELRSRIIDIFLEPSAHTIRLFNLSQGDSYEVFMVCGSSGSTNKISFIAGAHCGDKPAISNHSVATADSEDSDVSSYSDSGSYNAVEWPIAITFAVVGVIICATVAYYMWKKYQRRQRILRIFRQGQNDPFQALYSPTQDAYSF